MDPLEELRQALRRQGRPSEKWITRWSHGGTQEPVGAVWQSCQDSHYLKWFLADIGLYHGGCRCKPDCDNDPCDRCVATIKRNYPTVPTLEEILAKYPKP